MLGFYELMFSLSDVCVLDVGFKKLPKSRDRKIVGWVDAVVVA